MNRDTQLANLGPQFTAIERLQSISLRTNLVDMISTLHDLMKVLDSLEINPKVTEQTESYYKYLLDSCSCINKLNRRRDWLMSYGMIIRGRLEDEYYRLQWINRDWSEKTPTYDDKYLIQEKIATLIAAVGSIQVIGSVDDVDGAQLIHDSFKMLVSQVDGISERTNSPYFSVMHNDLDRLIKHYQNLSEGNVRMIRGSLNTTVLNDINKLARNSRHGTMRTAARG